MIGFFSFAAIYHLILWSFSRREVLLGVFGVDCGLRALFSAVVMSITTSSTILQAQHALHARVSLALLLMVTWVWSLSLISGVKARPYVWSITAFFLVLFPIHVFFVSLNPAVVALNPYVLPWGETISNPSVDRPGWWFAPVYLVVISIEFFGMYCGRQLARRDRVGAILLVGASGTLLVLHSTHILRAMGSLDIPFIGVLGHLLWASLIGLLIVRRIQETRQSEERFRLVFEGASDAILWADAQTGLISHCNQAAEDLLGQERPDIIGQSHTILHPPDEIDIYRAIFQKHVASIPQVPVEVEMIHNDGHRIIASVSPSVTTIAGRKVIQGIFRDITERKRAEEALKASEQRFSLFMQYLPGLAWIKDDRGRYVYANDSAVKVFRRPRNELYGKTDLEIFPRETALQFQQADQQALALGTGIQTIESLVHEDGKLHHAIVGKFSLTDPSSGATLVGGVAFDITERKRAEEALKESESRFRLIAELASSFSYQATISADHLVTFHWVNGKFLEVTGYRPEELSGPGWFSLIPPEDLSQIFSRIAGLSSPDVDLSEALEVRIHTRAGDVRWIRSVIHVVEPPIDNGQLTIFGAALDITERKQTEAEHRALQAQIQHSQKLESLGVLAGGIAHDFNNLLTVVLGNASLSLMQLPEDSSLGPMLREIEHAALSAADLTQQMLAYSGRGKFIIEPLRLDSLVQGMAALLKSAVSKKATIELDLHPAMIEADATQIRQVVMNLIINASEALEGNVGWIRVRTTVQHVDSADLSSPYLPETQPGGNYAIFEVEDNGCGMSEETLTRVFDPFYSTKFTGRGLGLAAVLGIIRGHRGSTKVFSTPGRGTIFQVFLPALTTIDCAIPAERAVALPHGRGTILVIDDELSILTLNRQILEGAGFQVLAADDGREGVSVFADHRHEINMVLVDLTMPNMDGLEVMRELRRQSPEIPIVIMSGYNEQEVSVRCDGVQVNGFIHKPFDPHDLLTQILEVLPAQS